MNLSGWWNALGDALHGTKLARIYLDQGNPKKAIKVCVDALMDSRTADSKEVSAFLGVMEDAYESLGKNEDFISFCYRFRDERADFIRKQKLTQWYLEPKSPPDLFDRAVFIDDFDGWRQEFPWAQEPDPNIWKIVDGELECKRRDFNSTLLITGKPEWKDYTIEYDVKLLDDQY